MKVWRIKTEAEFKEEGFWDYRLQVPYGWNSKKQMNYLLGQPLCDSYSASCAASEAISIDHWKLTPKDYVLEGESSTAVSSTNPIIVANDNTPRFDLKRLSEEIDELFQTQLKTASDKHKEVVTDIKEISDSLLIDYKSKIELLFPEIKDRLLEEVRRGHTTIVLSDKTEVPIFEMDHPKMKDVIISLQTQHKAMLVGPAGTGKTYMVADIAKRLNVPFYKYSCSRDSSVHDLLGYKQPASETYLETVFLNAYENGGIFLVDEYDAMSGDMALFFNGVADNSKFISVPHRDTKPIAEKHKDFFLVMCGNTWGKGSVEYSGRDFQDMALMDRFRFCRHFIGYHFDLELKWMGRNITFARELRASLEAVGSYLSTRNIEDIATLIQMRTSKAEIIAMITQDLSQPDKDMITRKLNNVSYTI